jgi:hypothetical protein
MRSSIGESRELACWASMPSGMLRHPVLVSPEQRWAGAPYRMGPRAFIIPHFLPERLAHHPALNVGLTLLLAERAAGHSPRSSASACSSQNRMSISRYIVVAVVRCSCASSLLPVRR